MISLIEFKILRIIVFIILLGASLGSGQEIAKPLIRPDGTVRFVIPIQEIAEFGEISLFFESGAAAGATLLEGGWSMPILDSHIQRLSERAVTFVHPNGRSYTVTLSGSSMVGAGWGGSVKDDLVNLSSGDEVIKFLKGKIIEFQNGDEKFTWLRSEEEREVSIFRNGILFLLARREERGANWSVILKGALEGKIVGDVYKGVEGFGLGSGSITDVVLKSGFESNFEWSVSEGLYSLDYRIPGGSGVVGFDGNGLVKSINDDKYSVEFLNDDAQVPLVERISANGDRKTIFDCTHNGPNFSEKFFPEGGSLKTSYIYPGRNKRVSKIEKFGPAGEKVLVYRAEYDEAGTLLRDWKGDYERRLRDGYFEVWKRGVFLHKYKSY